MPTAHRKGHCRAFKRPTQSDSRPKRDRSALGAVRGQPSKSQPAGCCVYLTESSVRATLHQIRTPKNVDSSSGHSDPRPHFADSETAHLDRNTAPEAKLGILDVRHHLQPTVLRYAGHVLRMNVDRTPSLLRRCWAVDGRRPSGKIRGLCDSAMTKLPRN